jgi:hypothetical protein
MDTAALVAMALFAAACGGSTSSPVTIVTLGSVGNEPNGMAVDGNEVYWTSIDWQSAADRQEPGRCRESPSTAAR